MREMRMHTRFWSEKLKVRVHSEYQARWEDNIRMGLRERVWRVWTEFIWLRTGTSGGL
jgi:hypothetical protein